MASGSISTGGGGDGSVRTCPWPGFSGPPPHSTCSSSWFTSSPPPETAKHNTSDSSLFKRATSLLSISRISSKSADCVGTSITMNSFRGAARLVLTASRTALVHSWDSVSASSACAAFEARSQLAGCTSAASSAFALPAVPHLSLLYPVAGAGALPAAMSCRRRAFIAEELA